MSEQNKIALLQNHFNGNEFELEDALEESKILQRYLYSDANLTEYQKEKLNDKFGLDVDKINENLEILDRVTNQGLAEDNLIEYLQNEIAEGYIDADTFEKGHGLFMDLPLSHQFKIAEWLSEASENSINTFLEKRIEDIENGIALWNNEASFGDNSEFWSYFREVIYGD